MKIKSAVLAVLMLALILLPGCGGSPAATEKPAPTEKPASTEKPAPAEMTVTILNSSGYVFNELYISPSSDTEWGSDHLGSTNILKKGGAYDVTLPTYDFNIYDIRVVDEDEDVYLFERVPLEQDCQVDIVWDSDLAAAVSYADDKEDAYVVGNFESSGEAYDSEYEDEEIEWLEMTFGNFTGWDFGEVYVYATGSSDIGYNHVADTPLNNEVEHIIGVDNYVFFDIACIDEDGDTWLFEDVYLEQGCYVSFFSEIEQGSFAEVLYQDNSVTKYECTIY